MNTQINPQNTNDNEILPRGALSVAPMMDWTDRHCRYFMRLLAPDMTLATEMITTGALINGDHNRFLQFHHSEKPLTIQLGGSDINALAECAELSQAYGYDEVNLNCGCPSDRVQKGRFGACLMEEPKLVSECVKAMADRVKIPVSVKCRIGIDEQDDYAFLKQFVQSQYDAGCRHIIIHARKAWLEGLSPKENREIPPLIYDRVYDIKKEFPDMMVTINGGIKTLEAVKAHLKYVDGVMIGREAYSNPYFLAELQHYFYTPDTIANRNDIALKMIPYMQEQQDLFGVAPKSVLRHMTGLYNGLPGARKWRQKISYHIANKTPQPEDIIHDCMSSEDIRETLAA